MSDHRLTLLSLPPELISKILSILLTKPTPIFIFYYIPTRWSTYRDSLSSQLLRVSRRLYTEGKSILYGGNLFFLAPTLLHLYHDHIQHCRYSIVIYQPTANFNPAHVIRSLSVPVDSTLFYPVDPDVKRSLQPPRLLPIFELAHYRSLQRLTFRLTTVFVRATDDESLLFEDEQVRRVLEVARDPVLDGVEVFLEFRENGVIKGQTETKCRRVQEWGRLVEGG